MQCLSKPSRLHQLSMNGEQVSSSISRLLNLGKLETHGRLPQVL